jgi:hypothetical protein
LHKIIIIPGNIGIPRKKKKKSCYFGFRGLAGRVSEGELNVAMVDVPVGDIELCKEFIELVLPEFHIGPMGGSEVLVPEFFVAAAHDADVNELDEFLFKLLFVF